MSTTTIGRGILNWSRPERIGDRYGAVTLWSEQDDEQPASIATPALGTVGTLRATVEQTRESKHIGDLFRGFSPGGAQVGEVITLGHGQFFTESNGDATAVGLRPLDGRETDWLDPMALYRAHEQTVTLAFVADEVQP